MNPESMLKFSMSIQLLELRYMGYPKKALVPNAYETPRLKKLKPQQAEQFLLHHAKLGDPGAKELLALISPRNENSRPELFEEF